MALHRPGWDRQDRGVYTCGMKRKSPQIVIPRGKIDIGVTDVRHFRTVGSLESGTPVDRYPYFAGYGW